MTPGGLTRIGGTASPSTDQLVTVARGIAEHFHISLTTSQSLRLAIRFKRRAPQGGRLLFFQFLAAHIQLSEEQKRAALRDPEFARVVGYADPTGELAVKRVLRQRGY